MNSIFSILILLIAQVPALLNGGDLSTKRYGFSDPRAQDTEPVSECTPLIEDLKQRSDWIERLYDPVLLDEQQLEEQITIYQGVFDCLNQQSILKTAEEQLIYRLTGYFLLFASDLYSTGGDSSLRLIDLQTVDDPAVEKIRTQLEIPAPQGYVFVRLYDSTAAMPDPIRAIFENSSVAGVTILTRYIAILDEQGATWSERALNAQSLPRTVSHELVHAYINSTIGFPYVDQLPTWYHEGVAIYFSNSGENQAIVTPNFRLYTTPPPEYRQYALNFDYVESLLGRDAFQSLIRKSVAEADADLILDAAGIEDQAGLQLAALEWQSTRLLNRLTVGLAAISVFAFLVLSGQLRNIGVIVPAEQCEICRRWYWGWRSNDINHYQPSIRVWVPEQSIEGQAYSVFARRVCLDCISESKETLKTYQYTKRQQIDQDRANAGQIYQHYLRNAPSSLDLELELEGPLLNEEQVVNFLVEIALGSKYAPPWFELEQDIVFKQSLEDPDYDPISTPPGGYERVLSRSQTDDNWEITYDGSIIRIGDYTYQVLWSRRAITLDRYT
jgi:hypothetical protein